MRSKIIYILPSLLLATIYLLLSAPSAHAGTIVKGPAYLGLQNGLVGCWTFDGAYQKAPDCSGNGAVGTLTGGPPSVSGKIGQALSFDGVEDQVLMAYKDATNITGTNPLTISAWVKPNSFATDQGITGHGKVGVGGYTTVLLSTRVLRFCKNSVVCIDSSAALYPNQTQTWNHVTFVVRSTGVDYYVNGAYQSTTNDSSSILSDTSNGASVGIVARVVGNDTFFNGVIDDVRIFNRALTANEVARIYKIGLGSKDNRSQGGDQFDKGLVGHWTFDGKDIGLSGTKALDRSGNNIHGTLTGGPRQAAGRIGQALTFDGSDDYVDTNNANFLDNLSALTVSAWIKLPTVPQSQVAIASSYASTGGKGILLETSVVGAGILVAINDGSNPYGSIDNLFSANQWYYVTMVFDGTATGNANRLKLYVNGEIKTLTFTGTIPATTGDTTKSFTIGASRDGSDNRYLNGSIDDVRVYNRALSSGEIKRLYDITQPKANITQSTLDKGLVGHWTLDGNDIGLSGTRAEDRSGNGNHGTLTNGPIQVAGKLGQAMSFDGVNDYVTVADHSSLDLSQFTLSSWVKLNSIPGPSEYYEFIAKRGGGAGYANYFSRVQQSGKLDVGFADSGLAWRECVTDTTVMTSTQTWYHIIGIYDGVNVTIYLNGSVVKTCPYTQTPNLSSNVLTLGALTDSDYLNGLLDDVRVYNRALSSGEVNKLYQMGR